MTATASTDFLALTPGHFATPLFEDVERLYAELLERPLDAGNFQDFLADMNALDIAVEEAAVRAQIAFDLDTNDEVAKDRKEVWTSDILPRLGEVETSLSRKILAVGIVPHGSEVAFADWSAEEKLFRAENIPLESELSEVESQYDNLIGSAIVSVEGKSMTLPEAGKELESSDRKWREQVWSGYSETVASLRPRLEQIWKRSWELRTQMAKNAGFSNFRDYAWSFEPTLGYGPEQTLSLYVAVEKSASPETLRLRAIRAKSMGLPTLRPWDLAADAFLRPAVDLGPGAERSIEIASGVLADVAPGIAALLETLKEKRLLDLDNRPGKSPGGYQAGLAYSGYPFIFMNAVGSPDDVQTLVHEMGHAYHTMVSSDQIRFHWDRAPGEEMAEVASMAMELMAFEHLSPESGLTRSQCSRLKAEHLESIVAFFAHCVTIDRLQHEIYTNPEGWKLSVADEIYDALSKRVNVGVNWTGLEDRRHLRWHVQAHVWTRPFYYVQYGIAQLAALKLWVSYMQDPQATFDRYTKALQLGGSVPLTALYEAAGTPLDFTAEGMSKAIVPAVAALERHWADAP